MGEMTSDQFSEILDLKLQNLNLCVEKIGRELDAHLKWHFGEVENARKMAEAALKAAQELAAATLLAAERLEEGRRWETWKLVLGPLIAALIGGGVIAFIKFP